MNANEPGIHYLLDPVHMLKVGAIIGHQLNIRSSRKPLQLLVGLGQFGDPRSN